MWALLKRWDFWFGLVGVVGVLFAVYTYFATHKVGQISYSFDTQKVFDPANLSGFTLVNPDKDPVERPVYATEVVVWNSGDLSLSDHSDRVREPLRISLNGVIYYHLVSKINLVDASNYRIDFSQDRSSVTINWKYFDPGQGIRLTLLHSSTGEQKVALSGRFFEASLREEPQSQFAIKRRAEAEKLWAAALAFTVIGILALVTRKLYYGSLTRFANRAKQWGVKAGPSLSR
jgi:hypothetical protein